MRLGSNDARHVVWAIGDFSFLLFFPLFFISNYYILSYICYCGDSERLGRSVMMITGPNDMSGVVCVVCDFFFI